MKTSREAYVRPPNVAQVQARQQRRTRRLLIASAIIVWVAVFVVGGINLWRFSYRWQPFISAEGGFSVEFPGKPTRTVQPVNGGSAGTTQLTTFSVDDPLLSASFDVAYEDLPDSNKIGDDPPAVLERIAKSVETSLDGSGVYEDAVMVGRYPGLDVSMSVEKAGGQLLKMRLVLVSPRVYTLAVTPFPKSDPEGNIVHFLNSFKITK